MRINFLGMFDNIMYGGRSFGSNCFIFVYIFGNCFLYFFWLIKIFIFFLELKFK